MIWALNDAASATERSRALCLGFAFVVFGRTVLQIGSREPGLWPWLFSKQRVCAVLARKRKIPFSRR